MSKKKSVQLDQEVGDEELNSRQFPDPDNAWNAETSSWCNRCASWYYTEEGRHIGHRPNCKLHDLDTAIKPPWSVVPRYHPPILRPTKKFL